MRRMLLVILLSGCDGELAPGGRDLLCPSCVPRGGGETSDFGGGSECEYTEQAMPDDRELRGELTTTMAAYAGSFAQPLRWSADGTAPPTVEETTIRGHVEFGDGAYFVDTRANCGDLVRVDATVVVETADGAVRTTSEGALIFRRADATSELTTASDLRTVRGNLDLGIDDSKPHAGLFFTGVAPASNGRSGSVAIEVSYFADRESAEAHSRGEKVTSTSEFRVVGTF